MSMNVGDIVIRLLADAHGLDRTLAASDRSLDRWVKGTRKVGDGLSKYVTAPILAAAGASAVLALDFERDMTKIRGLVGASAEDMQMYERAILDMAGEVGKAPKELANALYFITSSGFSGAEAIDVLTASAQASAAGLGDTMTVADAATSIVMAYGKQNITAAQAVDILTAAVREGKAEPEELAQGIGNVVSTAKMMGVEFNQLAASIATMTLAGIQTPEAITAINQAMLSLAKPTKEGSDLAKELGISYAGLRNQLAEEGIIEVFRTLQQATGGNIEQITKLMPNVRGLKALLALTGADAKTVSKTFDEVADSTGDMSKAFKNWAESDASKFDKAWGRLQAAGIEAGQHLVPALADVAEGLADITEAFSDLDPDTQAWIIRIGFAVAAIGPLLSIGARLATVYTALAGRTAAAAAAQEALNLAQAGGTAGAGGKLGARAAKATAGYAPGSYGALMAKALGMGGGAAGASAAAGAEGAAAGAAAAGGLSAAAAIGAAAAIAAISAAPYIVSAVVEKTIGNKRYGREKADSVITGGSKGGGVAGGGRWAAYRSAIPDPDAYKLSVVREWGTAMDDIVAKIAKNKVSLRQGGDAIKDYISKLREMRDAARDSGQDELADLAQRTIDKFRYLEKGTAALSQQYRLGADRVRELGDRLVAAREKAKNLRNEIAAKKKLGIDTKDAEAELKRVEAEIKKLRKKHNVLLAIEWEQRSRNNPVGMGPIDKPQTIKFDADIGAFTTKAGKVKGEASKLGQLDPKAKVGLVDNASTPAANLRRGLENLFGRPITQTILVQRSGPADRPQAYGGSYILDRATSFLAGEKSREIATFIPMNDPARAAQVFGTLQAQLAANMPSVFGGGGGFGPVEMAGMAGGRGAARGGTVINVNGPFIGAPPDSWADFVQANAADVVDMALAGQEAFNAQVAREESRAY